MPPEEPAASPSAMSDQETSTAGARRIDLVREPDFAVGRVKVRPSRLEVVADGRAESLERRVMQVLVALAQAKGATVSRDELLERCWDARIVGEPAIQRCISRLRRLGESPGGPFFGIENVPRLGYRLRAAEPAGSEPRSEESPPTTDPASHKARSSFLGRPMLALILVLLAFAAAGATWRWSRDNRSPLIAVLPFTDLSAGRDHAYFAEGVSEEILSLLAEEPDLRVIGRTSAARLKEGADLQALRRVLGVSHVLEGSVRNEGSLVRLNLRLLRSSDGVEVWSERYRRPAAQIFALQDEIGRSVAGQLRGALAEGERRGRLRAADVRAYDLYLAGRARLRIRERESVAAAQALFGRALSVDPAYAPALAALAEATRLLADDRLGTIPAPQARRETERLALEAIRLAPTQADGYAALGLARDYEASSLEPLTRAVRLAPDRADVRIWLAGAQQTVGRWSDAMSQYEAAYAIEPLWPNAVYNWVYALSTRGRFEEADEAVRRFAAFTDSPADTAWFRSIIAEKRGDLSETVRQARMAQRHAPDLADNNERLASTYAMLELRDRAAAALDGSADPLQRLIVAGRRREAADTAAALGPKFWGTRQTSWRGSEMLAAERRWRDLIRLYDGRFRTPQAFCAYAAGDWAALGVPFAVALRAVGRPPEAEVILGCTAAGVETWLRSGNHPASAWFFQAQVSTLQGERSDALDALERALASKWLGENTSADLSDYPALEELAVEPRFRTAEEQLTAVLRRERREVLAL